MLVEHAITLDELHEEMQVVMGWDDRHEYASRTRPSMGEGGSFSGYRAERRTGRGRSSGPPAGFDDLPVEEQMRVRVDIVGSDRESSRPCPDAGVASKVAHRAQQGVSGISERHADWPEVRNEITAKLRRRYLTAYAPERTGFGTGRACFDLGRHARAGPSR